MLAGLLCATAGHAEDRAAELRVLVVSAGHQPLAERLHAEALRNGWTPISAPPPASPETDAELASAQRVVAVLRVDSDTRVALYVAAVHGRPAYETQLERGGADDDDFALRLVEAVRARLVDLPLGLDAAPRTAAGANPHTEQEPPEQPLSAPKQRVSDAARVRGTPRSDTVALPNADETPHATQAGDTSRSGRAVAAPALARPAPRGHRSPRSATPAQLWLSAGLAGLGAEGGVDGLGQVALGARLEPLPRWAGAVHALLPITDTTLRGREGHVELSATVLTATCTYRLFETRARWSLDTGPAVGLASLQLQGEATPPFEGKEQHVRAGLLLWSTGLAWQPLSWLRLRLAPSVGSTLQRVVVRFAGREVAAWGWLAAAAALSAELRIPLADDSVATLPPSESRRPATPEGPR